MNPKIPSPYFPRGVRYLTRGGPNEPTTSERFAKSSPNRAYHEGVALSVGVYSVGDHELGMEAVGVVLIQRADGSMECADTDDVWLSTGVNPDGTYRWGEGTPALGRVIPGEP
jgi:hypothetical protein